MVHITFYLLTTPTHTTSDTVCRLSAKAWREGFTVHIYVPDQHTRDALDNALWRWREDSFLAHDLLSDNTQTTSAPITLWQQLPKAQSDGLLVNLTPHTISQPQHFKRVCEIIAPDEEQQALSRTKFRHYQQAGFTPEVHRL